VKEFSGRNGFSCDGYHLFVTTRRLSSRFGIALINLLKDCSLACTTRRLRNAFLTSSNSYLSHSERRPNFAPVPFYPIILKARPHLEWVLGQLEGASTMSAQELATLEVMITARCLEISKNRIKSYRRNLLIHIQDASKVLVGRPNQSG
jgi:hypothetical protein